MTFDFESLMGAMQPLSGHLASVDLGTQPMTIGLIEFGGFDLEVGVPDANEPPEWQRPGTRPRAHCPWQGSRPLTVGPVERNVSAAIDVGEGGPKARLLTELTARSRQAAP